MTNSQPTNQPTTRVMTIVAEGCPPGIYRIRCNKHVDPLAAIEAAAQEFVATPEGREYLEFDVGGDCFNWGDAVTAVPLEILDRHGIYALVVLDLGQDVEIVDHDQCITR